MSLPDDQAYMAQALTLAALGRFTTQPNPHVGCLLVKDGQIIGQGYHQQAGQPHAERIALAAAGSNAQGATAYVTLEPCSHHGLTPPCSQALIEAGIKRVVAATTDPNPLVAGRGFYQLQQASIEVTHGVLASQAEQLNRAFFKRMRSGLPYLQLKLAASLDGRTALASGASQWITSPEARQDVQDFRAQSSAILSTSATVLADDPLLSVRFEQLPRASQQSYPLDVVRQPLRVIIDSQNRVHPQLRLFQQTSEIWLARKQADNHRWPTHVKQCCLPMQGQHLDLTALLMQLAKAGHNSVWVEAGAQLAGALLQAQLVDELIVYLAPKLLGDQARALCQLPLLTQLDQALSFSISELTQIGPDIRIILKPQKPMHS